MLHRPHTSPSPPILPATSLVRVVYGPRWPALLHAGRLAGRGRYGARPARGGVGKPDGTFCSPADGTAGECVTQKDARRPGRSYRGLQEGRARVRSPGGRRGLPRLPRQALALSRVREQRAGRALAHLPGRRVAAAEKLRRHRVSRRRLHPRLHLPRPLHLSRALAVSSQPERWPRAVSFRGSRCSGWAWSWDARVVVRKIAAKRLSAACSPHMLGLWATVAPHPLLTLLGLSTPALAGPHFSQPVPSFEAALATANQGGKVLLAIFPLAGAGPAKCWLATCASRGPRARSKSCTW